MRRDREISAATSLFGHPMVAAALGALLGVLLTFISRRAASYVTPADPMRGMAVVGVMMGVRFLLALAALAAYYSFVPDGLVAFGLALAISFVVGLMFEAAKLSFVRATHTSV